jgi:methionine biosynthesis protein MetW
MPAPPRATRADLVRIADLVTPGARVLDVGCGDGHLLEILRDEREVDGRGVELSQTGVNACVARGLSVIQGDADTDLEDYPDRAFDFVVLSQTIQATQNPREVLTQMLRIGERVIVSFPNFGHWKVRRHLALYGRMPVTPALGYEWWETPNIHLCTLRDFTSLCDLLGAHVETTVTLDIKGDARTKNGPPGWWDNATAEQAIFLLKSR